MIKYKATRSKGDYRRKVLLAHMRYRGEGRGRGKFTMADCTPELSLVMRYRKPPAPTRRKSPIINDAGYTTWDQIAVDLSGPFRTRSYQGNQYYAFLKCMLTSKRMYFGLKKRSHFTITLLRSIARIGKWPICAPVRVQSDLCTRILCLLCTLKTSPPYHPPWQQRTRWNGSV